ncbi:carbohydrate binding domain-containing protein [Candidatus Saccharibacteria bacterium]|nr:carbohydrate binding domain-containing protein [Candidatus Saccharibacteria bacterium]
MWCKPNTILKQRYALRNAGLIALCVALITTLLFGTVSHATAGINQTLSYSGRLMTASGAVVADGYYNMQFKIYQDGAGTSAGNPGGTLKWTETRINNGGTSGVQVTNGFFSVNLGSVTAFGSSVDWNQDTLWLSMNIAGSATACTSFNSAPCVADGEMLPMKRITSTPYAMNAGQLGGKTAGNFIQLGQGVQEDSGNASSLFINKTGTGNLVELQHSGTNVFKLTNGGDIELGNTGTRSLYVATAGADTAGSALYIAGGYGGSGSGSIGGDLSLYGGSAGGTNANGGDVIINGGAKTGAGLDGRLYLGSGTTRFIQVGSTSPAANQTIWVGNNSSGTSTDIIIGAGSGASGGTTSIQSKYDTTITTNGTQRARFSNTGNTLYVGNADTSGQASTASSFTIQGTSSTTSNTQGGSLTLLAGSATSGNADGGNLYLSSGSGSGTGSKGLVVINTPTFTTASTQSASVDANVSQTNVDGFGVVTLNATADNVDFTLVDPSLGSGAAGRILYVTAANGSNDFMLLANVGDGAGVEQSIPLQQNTSVTMIWSGSVWTAAGSAGTGSLQSAYNNSVQSTGVAEILVNNNTSGDGLVIKDSNTSPSSNTILSVQSSGAAPLLSVNSLTAVELATDGGAETAGGSDSEFPTDTWTNSGIDVGGAGWWDTTVSRYTTAGNNIATGNASVKVEVQNAWTGARNKLSAKLTSGVTYNISFKVRADSSSFSSLAAYYLPDGEHSYPSWTLCTDSISATSSAWTNVSCSFSAPSSGITSNNRLLITPTSDTGTFYIDDLSLSRATTSSNIQVGGSDDSGNPTYLTLGKSAKAPADVGNNALLGSMYYDTTKGKIQCYEQNGWGSCGDRPDNFITISPEYANAVTHGTDIGTLSSDFCSDTLDINDGTSSQPTICGTNETYNLYSWTSAEGSAQTKDIYVTYKLPTTFDNFVSGSTTLKGRTDSSDASVAYQIYKNTTSGLTACGSSISVSTGSQTTWQTGTASGGSEPSSCSFAAGNSIVFKITLSSLNDANAYVSDLNFTFHNK